MHGTPGSRPAFRLSELLREEVFEIFPKLVRTDSNEPYGQGFWSERFKFLDYTGERFIEVQESLLRGQLAEMGSVPIASSLMNGNMRYSASEFMRNVPLTTIDDYAGKLDELRQSPEGRNYTWAYTLYGAGNEKWVPYTQRGLKTFADGTMGALGMASSTVPGRFAIKPGIRAVYNVPPRPYLAGIAVFELARRFGLKGVVDPDAAEGMEFEERIREEFNSALGTGVDLLVSMTSVLRRVSQRFAEGLSSGDQKTSSGDSRGIRAATRYLAARSKAKLSGRNLKPRDLWKPKAILGWGLDTRHYASDIEQDWGRPPFEMYASTEAGVMGLQYGPERGIALNPETCFFEFIPESELDAVRNDPKYTPQTALLPDVVPDNRYELVITSFYGMPFVRYRTGHLVRFSAGHLGYGPDLEHVGRADDRLDIGGFTRIDEATIWKAVANTGAGISDWIVRRETKSDRLSLSVYAETTGSVTESELSERLHRSLVQSDPLYADLESMLGLHPLEVTLLNPGTFSTYYDEMRMAGEELLARRPQRINAPDATVERLLALSAELGMRRAA